MSVSTVPDESSIHFHHIVQGTNRRRSLFPSDVTDSESDSDLGHISPLNFDSSFDQDDFKVATKQNHTYACTLHDETVGDYDILGVVENQFPVGCTPQRKHSQLETMSPLYLSPHFKLMETTTNIETPSKISPSFKLKTPHDAPNTNSKLPKLLRKSLLDTSEACSNTSKRKLSPENSPVQNKQLKLDPKCSRVRTTLFPEVDFALSTKSFYPKTDDILEKIMERRNSFTKSSVLTSTYRKPRTRKKRGQINAGVGHKIRKPKAKQFCKATSGKATCSAVESTAITEYIMDLKKLKSSEPTKYIENKENIMHPKQIIVPAVIPEDNVIIEAKKRPRSPDCVPDSNKKFFKSSRAKSSDRLNKNVPKDKCQLKRTMQDKSVDKSKNDFDMSDLVFEESEFHTTNINNIISCLEDENNKEYSVIPQENQIVLQAHSSVLESDNSILLHQPVCPADLILSPISQMCDVTSGLALNTPKKIRNLAPILEEITDTSHFSNEKMFPIFYSGHNGCSKKNELKIPNPEKKFKKLSDDQTVIDAGQKKFKLRECPECNLVYNMGEPNDEQLHFNYHNNRQILRFAGWKNERIVADYQKNGRIIHIVPGDSKIWWKKANELMDVINQDMGCYDIAFSITNCQVFMYIKNRTIIGCLVATHKSKGRQLLSSIDQDMDICSEETYPVKCGVPRIWVSVNHRRLGIATKMMDVLKRHFIMGYVLTGSDIAFSSPTELGKKFAQKYFNTNHFYIYEV